MATLPKSTPLKMCLCLTEYIEPRFSYVEHISAIGFDSKVLPSIAKYNQNQNSPHLSLRKGHKSRFSLLLTAAQKNEQTEFEI